MGMLSKSAKVKLKAILIIDIIIIGAAAGAYFYLQNNGVIANTPKPATFTLSDLNIEPTTAEAYDPILITFNITNIGNLQGSYIANLTINNVPTQNQTINLDGGGNSTIAQFTVSEETPGNYTAAIGDLTGSFTVTPLTATSSTIKLSNLLFNPTEAWVNQPVNATVDADNEGTDNSTLRVLLTIDSLVVQSKTIELAAGEISKLAFSFNLTTEGVHHIKVGSLSDIVTVVPTGYHTLTVGRTGQGSTPVPFTLNGVSHNTFYTALLPVGNYTIVMPNPLVISTGVLAFANWQDGDTNPTKTINLESWTFEIVSYTLVSGQASCPSLYTWNGTANHYVTDVSNPGWLGYIGGIEPNGNIVFSGGNPWDYVKLDPTQLATKTVDGNTFYDMTLAQQWDELFYLDAAKLVVVDHPAGTDVYTTMTNYLNKGSTGQVYTINSNALLSPIAATNQNGQNVLPDILKQDGVYTPGTNVFDSSSWNNMTLNQLTLDLGNLSSAKQIKLVVTGIVDWGPYQSYYNWIDQFQSAAAKGLITNYTPITPAPTMEIKQANGTWTLAPQDRQIPIPSDYNPRTFVVDLTGLFPKGISDYQIRFTNVWNVTYDYIGIDTSNQANINVQTLSPTSATLSQFWSTNSTASGNFTRYGDVTPLLQSADDMYVIGRQGDQVEMQFSTANLTAPAPGMVRDYFFEVAAWFKDPLGQWGFGFNFTTNPLPFMAMSGFPYPSNESYPYDAAHLAYLAEYNTREILATTNSAGATSTIQSLFAPTNNTAAKANTQIITTITFVAVVALASVLIDFGVLWYARKIKK